MSDYTEGFTSVNGDVVDATELETEFDAIATAVNSKLDADGSGTMTGALNMGSNKITSVTDPTAAQDAATKAYVDAASSLETVTTLSGNTAVTFTGIAADVKEIIMCWYDLSLASASAYFALQIGDSGGLETSGYDGAAFNNAVGAQWSADCRVSTTLAAGTDWFGQAHFILVDAATNTWSIAGQSTGYLSGQAGGTFAGFKALSGTLDRVAIKTTTSTFDAGSVNILVRR